MSVQGDILVVDDTLTSLILVTEMLVGEGYQVREAQDGKSALQMAMKSPPDIILLDVSLPDIDGIEVCQQLAANASTRNVPIILLSSYTESDIKIKGFSAGALDFIDKPFQRDELLARVHIHLELAALKKDLSRQVEEQTRSLRLSEARFRALIEQAPEAILVFDLDAGHHVDANRMAEELTGRTRAELLQLTPDDLYAPQQPEGTGSINSVRERLLQAQKGENLIFERILLRPDGTTRHCEVRSARLPAENGNLIRGSFIDISARIASQQKIHRLAYFDTLTGLANHDSLQEKLLTLAAERASGIDQPFALLLVDLDDFKFINDAYGHGIGDQLLCAVADRLNKFLKECGFVARRGGDEFFIVLSRIDSREDALRFAKLIFDAIIEPVLIGNLRLKVSASIGIAIFPDHGNDGLRLMRNAEMAMYNAKSMGKGCIEFFEAELAHQLLERVALAEDMRGAIENEQFILQYQPQIELASGRMIGVEALLRWQHPQKGMVSPARFIPIAEQSGLILPLGRWVLREACRQLKAWQAEGLEGVTMAVNLSVAQFQDDDLPQFVASVLRDSGLDPACLELEITESCAMLSPLQSISVMQQFREMGILLSIDDFGTGYSSLSYLTRLPINTLKIDQSFIKNIECDEKDSSICDTIAYLAHRMGMTVVAEGVETEEQLKFLISINADVVQGYLFSKPIFAADILTYVRMHPGRDAAGQLEYF